MEKLDKQQNLLVLHVQLDIIQEPKQHHVHHVQKVNIKEVLEKLVVQHVQKAIMQDQLEVNHVQYVQQEHMEIQLD